MPSELLQQLHLPQHDDLLNSHTLTGPGHRGRTQDTISTFPELFGHSVGFVCP